MRYYEQKEEEVFQSLGSSQNGLAREEAARRRERFGPNRLADAKQKSLARRFFEQMANPMIIVLIVSAILSGIIGEMVDMTVILLVVVLNAILGVVQESKSEKAIQALQAMTTTRSKVRRSGTVQEVDSHSLVPGDVVLLEAGDAVPADMRLFRMSNLKIDESALTGESVPVEKSPKALSASGGKQVPLGDRLNMAYMGCNVVYGRGEGVVTATGMKTEMGKIAGTLAKTREEATPLQQKLNQLSNVLSIGVLAICAFVFVFDLLRSGNFSSASILNTFMLAVSLAVAAVPEGLAAVVTIVLSIGVTNLSKRNAIIRKLTAVSFRMMALRLERLVTPMESTMVTTAARPSGTAATARLTASMKVFRIDALLKLPLRSRSNTKTNAQMASTPMLSTLLSWFSFCWSGVASSRVLARVPAILPISVFMPVAVTTPSPRP